MNENAKKWVQALRSGEFEQGQSRLRSIRNEYCCLGVACEIAAATGVIEPPQLLVGVDCYQYYSEDAQVADTNYLLKPVMEWLGLSTPAGRYNDDRSLASDNDNGMSFNEIADIIESEPEGLFEIDEAEIK